MILRFGFNSCILICRYKSCTTTQLEHGSSFQISCRRSVLVKLTS
ncbi:unnamed protein product [Brassica napus]|uniref:(rape) hypothetical protein n=1 Tax=Brassica napus TaxID=3708 RepID=A0A817A579_BRANA|nr:unnamed protein product [Brassica napus]